MRTLSSQVAHGLRAGVRPPTSTFRRRFVHVMRGQPGLVVGIIAAAASRNDCKACTICASNSEPSPKCTTTSDTVCSCIDGKTFSSNGKSPCTQCTQCSGTTPVTVVGCTLTKDTVCTGGACARSTDSPKQNVQASLCATGPCSPQFKACKLDTTTGSQNCRNTLLKLNRCDPRSSQAEFTACMKDCIDHGLQDQAHDRGGVVRPSTLWLAIAGPAVALSSVAAGTS